MRSKFLMIVAISLVLASCGYVEHEKPKTDHSEDNIVGQNLASVSSVTSENGTDQAKIAMYDPVVCRIHQFNMNTVAWERTLTPRYIGGNHRVMFEPNGNYVIDVVDAHFTVFNKDGYPQDPGVSFVGAPKNGSFRPSLGYLVMQDDSKTAVLVKINNTGNVTGTLSLGQVVYNDVSMLAGDVDDFGNLILALTDGKIAVINIDQTIANGDWAITSTFDSGLANINWLAPMHDGSRQILVKTKENGSGDTKIAILDTNTKTMIGAPYVVPSSRKVIKTSKQYDPHFIVRDDSSSSSAQSTVVYVQNSTIRTKTITNPIRNVLSSRVSVAANTWAVVDTDIWRIWDVFTLNWYGRILYDDYNIVRVDRTFQRFSLDRMTPLKKYALPNTTQVYIGESKILQLYPAKLGWAVVSSMMNLSEPKNIEKFNYPFIHGEPCQ